MKIDIFKSFLQIEKLFRCLSDVISVYKHSMHSMHTDTFKTSFLILLN